MHGAPVPAFPTVRVEVYARESDGVAEAQQRAQVVADVSPLVMRAVIDGNRAGAVLPLHAQNLAGDKVQGLVPADALIDRKSTRLNSSHANISYAVFCLKKKNKK